MTWWNPEHLDVVKRGGKGVKEWREAHPGGRLGGQWRQPRGQLRAAAVKLYWLCSRVQTCLSIRRQSPPPSPRPAQQLPACFTRLQ